VSEDIPYEQRRNPNLPWGYWMISTAETEHWPPLRDEHGAQWRSVREAFWVSRLSMAPIGQIDVMHEELEFLLGVLVAVDRRVIGTEEQAMDLFESWDRSRHYGAWLHGQKLVTADPGCGLSTSLSPEGHAVLVMLASTCRPDDMPMPIGLPTLRRWHGLNAGVDEETRETILAAQKAAAERLRYWFRREEVGGSRRWFFSATGWGRTSRSGGRYGR
jgi:hypothetical protein